MSEQTKAYNGLLVQSETNYIPLSTTKGKACANCRWFEVNGWEGEPPECHIVANWPEPILATGYCDRWEATPVPQPIDQTPVPVVIVELDDNDMIKEVEKRPSVMDRLKALFIKPPAASLGFEVLKGKDNKFYWHAAYTNNLEDLDGEILSAKAHTKYINRLDMGLVPMPTLRIWHIKGTDHGQADTAWYTGSEDGSTPGVVHAVGHFYDTDIAKKAIAYYRNHPTRNSHGFISPTWAFKEGIYHDYNTFEISTLPPHAAANPFTSFEEIKEMTLTDEKRKHLEEMGLADSIPTFEAVDNGVKEVAKETDAIFKSHGDFADTTKPAEEQKPVVPDANVKALLNDVIASQGEFVTLSKQQLETVKQLISKNASLENKIKAFEGELNDVRKQINLKPSRASESSGTIVKETDGLSDALPVDVSKDQSFWGAKMKGTGA